MRALIIAAGNGTRMQPVICGRHKSLMELLSLKIIERVVLASKEAGILEFLIVVGYKGDGIKKQIGNGQRYGVSVEYIENKKWEKSNGISVLLAKDFFQNEERFALLMSDHVFNSGTLRGIKRVKIKRDECVLAIDKNLKSALDIEDTTKAMVKNGRVVRIGKNIEEYNAYDTGMFVCTPQIFNYLDKTTKVGKNSLTDGIKHYVSNNNLKAYDIKGNFWADCDTYEDIKFAKKGLLKSLTKNKDGIISKTINRKFSTSITRLLIKMPITPNMISFIILLFAPLAFIFLAQGTYPWLIIGGLLIQFMSIADGCDGEVARLKLVRSEFGGFLDRNLDKYIDATAIAGMAVGYLKVTNDATILPVAIFLMLGLGLDGYMPNVFRVETGHKLKIKWPIYASIGRDFRLLILALGAIFNQVMIVFLILLVIYNLRVVFRLIAGKRILNKSVLAS